MSKFFVVILIISLSLVSCQTSINSEKILSNSVRFHGGLNAMKNTKGLSFKKETISYDSTGVMTGLLLQTFIYDFMATTALLSWEQGTDLWQVSKEKEVWKLQKGSEYFQISPAQEKAFEATLNGSFYVYLIIYKLFTDRARKTYTGTTMLQGKKAFVIEVYYENSEDLWTYYFDVNNFRLVANRVNHKGRYSLIINDSTEDISSFSLAKTRTSYRVNAQNEILFKQASYQYDIIEGH